MQIEIIISTMNNQDVESKISKMNLLNKANILVTVVNQYNNNGYKEEYIKYISNNLRVIYTETLGIGNSRNIGLKNIHTDSDIICFTDDDLVYEDNFGQSIINLFNTNKKLEVAVFNVTSLNEQRKIQAITKKHSINCTNIFRYAMYNIAIKKDILHKIKELSFSNKFGGNSKYLCGEDSLFIYNLYKSKVKFIAFPCNLATVNHEKSTWHEKEFTDEYFISKGALFYACDKRMHIIYILYFAIKHSFISKKSLSYIIKLMIQGKNKYIKEDIDFEDYIMEC